MNWVTELLEEYCWEPRVLEGIAWVLYDEIITEPVGIVDAVVSP